MNNEDKQAWCEAYGTDKLPAQIGNWNRMQAMTVYAAHRLEVAK